MHFTQQELQSAPAHFSHPLKARFQDCDAAGIAFYARIFDWFHDAYVEFLASIGHPLHETLEQGRWVAPMRHAEADYLRPIRFGDAVTVSLVRARFEGSVLTLGYRLDVASGAAVVGQTVHVWVDPTTFKRVPPPEDLAAAFTRIG